MPLPHLHGTATPAGVMVSLEGSVARDLHPMEWWPLGADSGSDSSSQPGESVQRFDWLRRLIWLPPSTHLCRAEPL